MDSEMDSEMDSRIDSKIPKKTYSATNNESSRLFSSHVTCPVKSVHSISKQTYISSLVALPLRRYIGYPGEMGYSFQRPMRYSCLQE